MELNSFLDNAMLHCDESMIDVPPVKQLPRPANSYNITFYMKNPKDKDNLTVFKHNIILPDSLYNQDITK